MFTSVTHWSKQFIVKSCKKHEKCNKTIKHISVASAARRGIIGVGGGGAPIHKNRRRRRPRNVGGGGAARPAQGSNFCVTISLIPVCAIEVSPYIIIDNAALVNGHIQKHCKDFKKWFFYYYSRPALPLRGSSAPVEGHPVLC